MARFGICVPNALFKVAIKCYDSTKSLSPLSERLKEDRSTG